MLVRNSLCSIIQEFKAKQLDCVQSSINTFYLLGFPVCLLHSHICSTAMLLLNVAENIVIISILQVNIRINILHDYQDAKM